MGIYEEENRYEVTDNPRPIGKCEVCEEIIFDDEEHYDFLDELVCVNCKDEFVNDRFYRY